MSFLRWFIGLKYRSPLVLRAIYRLRYRTLYNYTRPGRWFEAPTGELLKHHVAEAISHFGIVVEHLYLGWLAVQSSLCTVPMIRTCKYWFDQVVGRGSKRIS